MLTLEDRLALHDLYARYAAYRDLGDIEAWAGCFTEDGIFHAGSELRGRKQIAASRAPGTLASEPYANVQHWTGNLILEGNAQNASGACYLLRIAKSAASGEIKIITQVFCEDRLVKVEGQWLIAYRKAHFDLPPADIIPRK